MHAPAQTWKSEDNSVEPILSLHLYGFQEQNSGCWAYKASPFPPESIAGPGTFPAPLAHAEPSRKGLRHVNQFLDSDKYLRKTTSGRTHFPELLIPKVSIQGQLALSLRTLDEQNSMKGGLWLKMLLPSWHPGSRGNNRKELGTSYTLLKDIPSDQFLPDIPYPSYFITSQQSKNGTHCWINLLASQSPPSPVTPQSLTLTTACITDHASSPRPCEDTWHLNHSTGQE